MLKRSAARGDYFDAVAALGETGREFPGVTFGPAGKLTTEPRNDNANGLFDERHAQSVRHCARLRHNPAGRRKSH